MVTRRVKAFKITAAAFIAILTEQSEGRYFRGDLLADADFVSAHYNHDVDQFVVILEHPTFREHVHGTAIELGAIELGEIVISEIFT